MNTEIKTAQQLTSETKEVLETLLNITVRLCERQEEKHAEKRIPVKTVQTF